MEPNIEQGLRDELAGLERRVDAMSATGINTTLLERRIDAIKALLGEPEVRVNHVPIIRRNAKGRETRPAGTGDTPES